MKFRIQKNGFGEYWVEMQIPNAKDELEWHRCSGRDKFLTSLIAAEEELQKQIQWQRNYRTTTVREVNLDDCYNPTL